LLARPRNLECTTRARSLCCQLKPYCDICFNHTNVIIGTWHSVISSHAGWATFPARALSCASKSTELRLIQQMQGCIKLLSKIMLQLNKKLNYSYGDFVLRILRLPSADISEIEKKFKLQYTTRYSEPAGKCTSVH
jgi:hypothetical protein